MLIDALPIFEPHAIGNLSAGGRQAMLVDELLNKLQNFQLLRTEHRQAFKRYQTDVWYAV